MRALKSYGIALVLVLLVAGWLITGKLVQGGLGPEDGEKTVASLVEEDGGLLTNLVESTGLESGEHHAEGAEDPALTIAQRNELNAQEDGEARSVRIKTFRIQPMRLEVPLRGHTAVTASVTAVAETSGIVETILVKKGQVVTKGDLICTLNKGTREENLAKAQADLIKANAALTQAQTGYDANKRLRDRGLATINSADTFEAALRGAEASIKAEAVSVRSAERELEKTDIHASMAGVIQTPVVEVGTLLGIGSACATILQLDPMVFVGAIPQARISLAKLGMPAKIKTINGQLAEGKVSFISSTAVASTRTFEVEIEFPNPGALIFDGLTAEAQVDMGAIPAHLLPQSILTLDGEGTLGVRAVEDSKVVFYPITILNDVRDGIWVTGLPLSVDIIVLGQEYVKAGQIVDAGNFGETEESMEAEQS